MDNGTYHQKSLIFVYNADSGLLNTLKDITHKILSPDTYSCQLCNLTHSAFGMRRNWQEFLDGLDMSLAFLHKNEFKEKYPETTDKLPAIFEKNEKGIALWLSADEINQCKTIIDLRELITDRLNQN